MTQRAPIISEADLAVGVKQTVQAAPSFIALPLVSITMMIG